MIKYSEETLKSWCGPASDTEEEKINHVISMIEDAVSRSPELGDLAIEVFVQGSYANNTNVRQNSDVDICVMLTSTFFYSYVDGKTNEDYGYTAGSIKYVDYQYYIVKALKEKFGDNAVTVGNKSINIKANSYRVNADVVPAFQYRDFKIINGTNPTEYVEGIKYFAKDGAEVINYPKDHISNGQQKNNDTNYEYKKLVRIMKHIRNDMVDDGTADGGIITSFLIECLVWNVPNDIITGSNTWTGTLLNAIVYLWSAIKDDKHREWGEVSERLYLFHSERKWTAEGTKGFLDNMYNYLEFK